MTRNAIQSTSLFLVYVEKEDVTISRQSGHRTSIYEQLIIPYTTYPSQTACLETRVVRLKGYDAQTSKGQVWLYCSLVPRLSLCVNEKSMIRLRSIKSSLPSLYSVRHSRDKIFQALYRFSVLQATESWAGSGNEASSIEGKPNS